MNQFSLHVYLCNFEDEESGFEYTQEKYTEDGDAYCDFWQEVGADWLDHDFIEFIWGAERFDYLKRLAINDEQLQTLIFPDYYSHNSLILIFGLDSNEQFVPQKCSNLFFAGSILGKFS